MNDHKGYLMHGLGAVVVMMTMVDRLPLTLDPCLLFPVWFWASHYKGTTGTSRPRRQPRIHLMTRCSSTAYYVLYVGSCGRRVCLVNLGRTICEFCSGWRRRSPGEDGRHGMPHITTPMSGCSRVEHSVINSLLRPSPRCPYLLGCD
jgi:hypothetical protein